VAVYTSASAPTGICPTTYDRPSLPFPFRLKPKPPATTRHKKSDAESVKV